MNVSATFENTVTATFKNASYSDGKAILTLSIDFPRDETYKYFGSTFTVSFSETGVYLDETGLSNNGKTGATRRVWLYGSDGFVYGDNDEKILKADWKTGSASNPKYDISVEIYPDCTSNPVDISIPLLIPDTVTDNISVSATNVSSIVRDSTASTMEEISPVFVSGTIEPKTGDSPSPIALEVGEGKDITNNTKGAATVTGTVENGTATLNVVSDQACTVAYTMDDGATYTRVSAAQADSGYNFVVPDYTDSMKFVVGLSGDVDQNGSVGTSDYIAIATSLLPESNSRYRALNPVNRIFADADGNGSIGTSDYIAIATSLLPESNSRYRAIAWK
jgi:hypothetical protein